MLRRGAYAVVLFVLLEIYLTEASPSAAQQSDVYCFVCQWSKLSGFTSPFVQKCSETDLMDGMYRKRYLQKCSPGSGCMVSILKQGTTDVAIQRSCQAGATNMVIKTRYCRGNDCNAAATGAGTTVSNSIASCKQVGPTRNTTELSTLVNGTARAATPCPMDTPAMKQFCVREVRDDDIAVLGPSMNNIPGPNIDLKCAGLDPTAWTANEYSVETKTCVNSYCNGVLAASAAGLKVFTSVVLLFALIASVFNH